MNDAEDWIEDEVTSTYVHVETLVDGEYQPLGNWSVDDFGDTMLTDYMPYRDSVSPLAWNLTILALNKNYRNWKMTEFQQPPPVPGQVYPAGRLPSDASNVVRAAVESLNHEFVTVVPLSAIRDYDWHHHIPGSPAPELVFDVMPGIDAVGGSIDTTRVYIVELEN